MPSPRTMLPTLLSLALLLILVPSAWGHGLKLEVERTGTTCEAVASYDDGQPLSNARIVVFGPGHQPHYLEGETDAHGRYRFQIDGTGLWRVLVDDYTGHLQDRFLTVGPAELNAAQAIPAPIAAHAPATKSDSRSLRILLGLVLIGGVSLLGVKMKSANRIRREGSNDDNCVHL